MIFVLSAERGFKKPGWGYFLRAESFLQMVQSNFRGNGQIHPIDYEDTDSYQITKMFIENKEQLLKRLLDE